MPSRGSGTGFKYPCFIDPIYRLAVYSQSPNGLIMDVALWVRREWTLLVRSEEEVSSHLLLTFM